MLGCKLNLLTCELLNYKLNARGQSWSAAEIQCILHPKYTQKNEMLDTLNKPNFCFKFIRSAG